MRIPKLIFRKTNRLQTPVDFQAVFNQPLRSRSAYFTILARSNNGTRARLGIIVAKRLVKRAVDRNALRRVIRESFRAHQRALSGLDVVVLMRFSFIPLPNQTFYDCLKQQWKELLKERSKG